MNKFLFKSSDADFQKLLQLTNKNILYVTYVVDKIFKLLQEMNTDKDLQTQVDNYFVADQENNDKEPD